MARIVDSVRDFVRSCERFIRDYTAGLKAQDLRRLFDQEATEAFDVLVRDHGAQEPADGVRRFFHRTRIIFLGLSYKLTPARRILFAGAIFFLFAGLFGVELHFGARVQIDFSVFWFVLSIGSLVFLLALELVDRIRVRDELEVARELQSELLPRTVPELAGYRISHAYRTANEVGGDYYDFLELPDGRLALLVGDASGHGMAAGLVMAIANATLKLAVDLDPTPARVVELLNRTLCRTGGRRSFMSLFYGLLDPATGVLEFVCAGHPYPLLRRTGDDVRELGSGSLPLGFRLDLELESDRVTLLPGDLLVLFSDGIPEAVDKAGDAFGYDRLADLVRAPGSTQGVMERILVAHEEHQQGEPLQDDFSLVVIRRGADVPLPPPPASTTSD